MKHAAAQKRQDVPQGISVDDAEPGIAPGRVGKIVMGITEIRIDPHAEFMSPHIIVEPPELRYRIEYNNVGILLYVTQLVSRTGNAIRMRFPAELFVPEAHFIKRTAGRPVHILSHEAEHTPYGKTFQGKKEFRAGDITDMPDDPEVIQQFALVNQIIRCRDSHHPYLKNGKLFAADKINLSSTGEM
jgi:hypothetical protein